jgi:hypothetical protein
MLTPNAKEQEIVQIIDNSEQIWLIESMDVNALFIRTDFVLRTNIHDNKKVNILFSINRQNYLTEDFDFSIKMEDNPHYQITDVENNLVKGNQVNFNILEKVPLLSIPTHTILGIDIVYDKVKYPLVFFTPEHINFEILNKGIRKMEIKAK